MANLNASGVIMDALWFVAPAHRDLILPGDRVRIIGFRQYLVERNDKEVLHGNVPMDCTYVATDDPKEA